MNSPSIATSASSLVQFDMIGMADAEMSGQRIVPAECLLLSTQMTPHFLLARIVDGVLMSCEIVWARENGVARFPS